MSKPAWYKRVGQRRKRLSDAERYYERGLYHYQKNQLDLATADLDEAIAQEPKQAEFYVARGLILLESGKPDEAEEDFAMGLELDLTQWLAYYGRGIQAFDQGDYAGAIAHFSRAQHIAPDRPEVYYYRAVAFHLRDNVDEAVRDMEYAQQLLASDDKRRGHTKKWLNIFQK